MTTPIGYNNPAYSHQYDSSLYDYQYVPEIDPDSPDLSEDSSIRTDRKLIHPIFSNYQKQYSESDEFEGSDESNHSIIIEECNNRRVTLICEKRSKTEAGNDEFYQDGAYYQDISLESENGYEIQGNKAVTKSRGKTSQDRSFRHQRPLEPPGEECRRDDVTEYSGAENGNGRIGATLSFKQSTVSVNGYQRPQRYHRYEEIPGQENYVCSSSTVRPSVHRYAEISPDENGYPTLKKEIKVEESREFHPIGVHPKENFTPGITRKPRAISPVNYPKSFSPPVTPSRTNPRTSFSNEFSLPQFNPKCPSPNIYSSSPIKTNSFEMSDLSPPRSSDSNHFGSQQTIFIHSPKRQPPVGVSNPNDIQQRVPLNGRCILPKNLQQTNSRSGKQRSLSVPNSPKRRKDLPKICNDSGRANSDKKITHIFHIKSAKPSQTKVKPNPREKPLNEKENNSVRRNISNSFVDPPKGSLTPKRESMRSLKPLERSPYKSTTVEAVPPKTAIITPIFQRRNHQSQEQNETAYSPKRNFEKMSQVFQSTGDLYRSKRDHMYPQEANFQASQQRLASPTKIKRNQSVPNFQQTFSAEKREMYERKYTTNLDFQYSPTKKLDHQISIDKSRISLIDQTSSWSTLDSDSRSQCSICFIFAAIVHLVTATATCAISFYLLSKVGRKYYLDFGILAGFVNFILGLLGFRSYCWRWLPNRNYVSGFIGLAAFSAFTCAGLSYIITARPMAGNPILDIMGGAICAVSVLTIFLALTGLTMSGCCKAPPPDNRVTNI